MPTTLILSSLMAASSSSWVMVWMALEINTLALCFLMNKKTNESKKSNNATFLYLCVQILTSATILITLIQESYNMKLLMILAMLMKMGGWPLHTWYISLISKMSMKQTPLFLVMTWQKIIPILMISSLNTEKLELISVIAIAMACVLVPLSAMKASMSMKNFLAISSLNNNGWLLVNSLGSLKTLTYFLFFYSISLKMVFDMVKKMKKKNMVKNTGTPMMVLVVSNMSGLPPFTMFWAKLMVVKMMIASSVMALASFVMIMSACYLLYFYMWMTNSEMSSIPLKTQNPVNESNTKFMWPLMFVMSMSIYATTTLDYTKSGLSW